jgi:hypothetical protein
MPPSSGSAAAVRIQIAEPKRFKTGAVLAVCVYGLLVMTPVLLSMMVVSVLSLGWFTFALPLAAIVGATFLLPFGFGNPYVTRLVGRLADGESDRGDFIVQLTFTPRLRSGLRAVLEDADDVGWLRLGEHELVFAGDSVKLSVPYSQIQGARMHSIGWRGLFLCGQRTDLTLAGISEVSGLSFAERSSWLLPNSRATSRRLYQAIASKLSGGGARL